LLLYSGEVLSFGVRQRSFERGRAKFDFDSGVAISWFSIVLISITPLRIIELNEVLGTVEANSSPKRSRECAYSLRGVTTIQIQSSNQSQLQTDNGRADLLLKRQLCETTVSFRIQTGLCDLIHGWTKSQRR